MEFSEQEEEEENMEEMTTSYDSPTNSKQMTTIPSTTRYRECLKNQAVGLGGHAVDGCGEFLPSGPDGTLDSFNCAACSCHRNFHRRESTAEITHHQIVHYFPLPPPPHQPHGYFRHLRQEDDHIHNHNSSSKKRFRTKFSSEQKEKMLGLAESLGWRIQKQDEDIIQRFCSQNGVRRHVLKVWMHNNKHTLGKKP